MSAGCCKQEMRLDMHLVMSGQGQPVNACAVQAKVALPLLQQQEENPMTRSQTAECPPLRLVQQSAESRSLVLHTLMVAS